MYVPADHGLAPRDLFRPRHAGDLPFPLSAPQHRYFYRARNAIYHVFRALGFESGGTVLMPAYHNTNEVAAVRAAGARVRFYRIGRDLEPDLEELARLIRSTDVRALFVIHYFGWAQPVKELLDICEARGLVLFEDCALALLSETLGRPLGSFGHYATYCLYKTLPVPNGGVLVENVPGLSSLDRLELAPCGAATLWGRSLELLLETLRDRSYRVGQSAFRVKRAVGRVLRTLNVNRVPFGDIGFDRDLANVAISPLSLRLLDHFDYDEIRRRRRENFGLLRERLDGGATLFPRELEAGMCPTIFPILVPDKPAAARALRARGIDAMEFWNSGDPEVRGKAFADAQFLRDHVLELPIHQDITPAQVEYMAGHVLNLKLTL
jgi:perosamine synthetase